MQKLVNVGSRSSAGYVEQFVMNNCITDLSQCELVLVPAAVAPFGLCYKSRLI